MRDLTAENTLDLTVGLLRKALSEAQAKQDIFTRADGPESRQAHYQLGECNAFRGALHWLTGESFDDIDARAESAWRAAVEQQAGVFTRAAEGCDDATVAAHLRQLADVARTMLAERPAPVDPQLRAAS